MSEDECPRSACTVPNGVPTESSRVAFACRSQCQPTSFNPSFLHVGLSCRLTRLCLSNGVPASVLNTKASGFTPAGYELTKSQSPLPPREPTVCCVDS